MPPWLVPLEAIAHKRGSDGAPRSARRGRLDLRAIGGKAAGLAWLVRHAFPVPEAWVLPADAFAAALRELPPGCEPRSLLRAASGRAGYTRAAEARQEILAAELPRGSRRSSPSSGRRSPSARRGASRCGRARRARTARSSRWRGSRRRSSACAAAAGSRTPCAPCGRRSRRGARSRTSPRTACATSGWRSSSSGSSRPRRRASCSRARPTRASRAGRADRQRGLRARLAGRRRRHHARHAPLRSARAGHRVGHRAQGARDGHRSRRAPRRSTSPIPIAPRSTPRASPRSPRSRSASRSSTRSPGTSSSRATGAGPWVVQARPATGRGFPEGGDARDGLEQRQRRRGDPRRRDAAHVVGRRRVQRGGLSPRVRGARLHRAEARAARRQRPRALLPEPHPVHAHRRAGPVARPARARRARRRRGGGRAGDAGGRRLASAASTRASR